MRFKQGLFNMSTDSNLFCTAPDLFGSGASLKTDGRFHEGTGNAWLPLYEAKMIHQYDHRFATYADASTPDKSREVTFDEHADPEFVPLSRYWVSEREVKKRVADVGNVEPRWFLGFRDIARNTDERTAIFSIVPWAAAGHTMPLIFTKQSACRLTALLACANSIPFDYVVRQKMGGTHLTFGVLRQLPVIPADEFTPELLDEIVPRVVELVYTAHDLTAFARDCGYDGPPFIWDEARRAQLRAELDGIYAHLYGLPRADFAYILDQFPIVARNDEKAHGEFRTKRLCLAAWDRFEGIGH